jgi:hypothetical protein
VRRILAELGIVIGAGVAAALFLMWLLDLL